jgi:hypothetical protein
VTTGGMGLLMGSSLFAQEIPRIPLKPIGERIVQGESAPDSVIGATKCDNDGNVYFRRDSGGPRDIGDIKKVTPRGELKATFSLASADGFKVFDAYDFVVGEKGEVYQFVNNVVDDVAETYIVSFRNDGAFQSKAKLDLVMTPAVIAALPDDKFFVTGERIVEENGINKMLPVTAIFNRTGQLVRNLQIKGDIEAEVLKQNASRPPLEEVMTGQVGVAEDGNVYLMRRTGKPTVFVISATGKLIRKLQIEPPSDYPEVWAMKVAKYDRLILEFGRRASDGSSTVFSLIDATTGKRLIDYTAGKDAGGIFGCYSPNAFTFLSGTKQNQLAIKEVKPQ